MKKFLRFFVAVMLLVIPNMVKADTLSHIPENPKKAMIIIHGYGGDGHRLSWMTDVLKNAMPDTAFYYPTAPDNAPSGGYQWFAIPHLGERIKEKALYDLMMTDALKNVRRIHYLVDEIHDDLKIPYENIYVSGFSQGGLMALLTVLTNNNHLTKAVSFSGVPLLFTSDFTKETIKNRAQILLIQGTADRVIPEDSLDMTSSTLYQLKIKPTIKEISGMGHQINSEAMKYMLEFVTN